MDKKKSILNISVSVGFKIITMLMVILVKKLLIQTCGNEVNGLNALFLSIVGFLAVAELGVGSAITFCMYKPIVDGDNDKVSALYTLFRRLYRIIGVIILLCGLLITPFLPIFAKDYAQLDVNVYMTFILVLVSVVITYWFGAENALINAYKNDYINTVITSGGLIVQYILQIVVLLATRSFTWYLLCRIAAVLLQWILTKFVARRKYGKLLGRKTRIDQTTRLEVTKNVKAMFLHKVGTLLVNTADSIIISAFVGVVVLGEYSNYATIMASMTGVIKLAFTSLTAIVGHLCAEKNKEISIRYCKMFHSLNFVIGTVFYLGYYAVIDNLVAVLFSADLVIEKSVSFVITLNGFVQFMRSGVLLFRDATGTFYYDRWKPLAEGLANVVLSILFVKWFGVLGVIAATVVTNLLICHIVEPYVLYKYAFGISPRTYYARNYGMILIFAAALALLSLCGVNAQSQWMELLLNGCISVGVSAVIVAVVFLCSKDMREWLMGILRKRYE